METLLPGVRLARSDELTLLQDVERDSGQRFRRIGMDSIADDDPPDIATFQAFQRGDRAWVVVDELDRPVGFAFAVEVDGGAHLQQLSVLENHGNQGLGRRLVDQVEQWGREHDLAAVTLSTFRDVPWNGPMYARWGFEVIPMDQLGPGLKGLRDDEAEWGLDVDARQFMVRPIPTVAG
jgi:GNAT superfamily N-acetyltransferase